MTTIDRFDGEHAFLSNFYIHNGWSVEHHYQAAKTSDPVWAARILAASTPGKAKRLGRAAPMRPAFEQQKRAIMMVLLRLKFSDPELGRKLLDTGDATLIEGNTWGDRYWGVCNGLGLNWLGRLLMIVRDELRKEAPMHKP